MKQIPVELQNLFAVSDTLKSKKKDAWKQDSLFANNYAESFQQFDVDAVSLETYTDVQASLQEGWFKQTNFKTGLAAALYTWVNEVNCYGAILCNVKPKRTQLDLNESALSTMVTQFTHQKAELAEL